MVFTGVSKVSPGSVKQRVLDEPWPRFFLGVTRTGVRGLQLEEDGGAGDCINLTATLLGVFTGVLNVVLVTGLSLPGVLRIDLALRPDLGVGG